MKPKFFGHYKSFEIHWGTNGHLKAFSRYLKKALKNCNITFWNMWNMIINMFKTKYFLSNETGWDRFGWHLVHKPRIRWNKMDEVWQKFTGTIAADICSVHMILKIEKCTDLSETLEDSCWFNSVECWRKQKK